MNSYSLIIATPSLMLVLHHHSKALANIFSVQVLLKFDNREISAARDMLNQYAGIPLGKIKGFRAPFCKYISKNLYK
jgi:hypothetical protein